MIAFVLLVPLLVAMLAISLSKSYGLPRNMALLASVVSLLLFPFVDSGATSLPWFSINGVQLTITLAVTPLSSILLLIVLLIAPLIFAYSFGFMNLPSEQRRYYAEMLAFETAMLSFAMAGDFVLLFIAWEFLSLTSYLLIGFWHGRDKALVAARKTITIILIGDMALLASIVMFQNAFGTLQFAQIISQSARAGIPPAAIILLVIAVMTKSAQFPFHEWLPDAMEGPTPVSAFLHSSTMVKAGVFATLVLFPLFSAANVLGLLLMVGAITVVVSALNAMKEKHVKKVLAYSTIQELGLMFVAISSNALLAAIYFFFAQSFYKALLFFSAGVAMRSNGREDLDEMTGMKQSRMVHLTTIFGVLALAGFVPFDGFFANVGLGAAFSTNLVLYAFISLVGLWTSFYIFRWLLLQEKRPRSLRVSLGFSSVARSMSFSMVILSLLVLGAGVGFFILPGMLSGVGFIPPSPSLSVGLFDSAVETVVIVIGAFAAYSFYGQKKSQSLTRLQSMHIWDLAYTPRLLNAAYAHIAAFVEALADAAAYFEAKLNGLFDWVGHLTIRTGALARKVAVGEIDIYVAIFALGLLLLIILAVI